MKRLLIRLVLVFAVAGCTTTTPDEAPATTSEQAPASTPEAMGPGDYAFVTQSGAEGVISVPSTDGARSIAVTVDNTTGTDPVSLTGVTLKGANGQEFLYTSSSSDVPPLSEENLVFTGEEIPPNFNAVAVHEFEGSSVNAVPVE
ncbi:hypothetical protein [Arthrobacter sp. D2-10]